MRVLVDRRRRKARRKKEEEGNGDCDAGIILEVYGSVCVWWWRGK